MNSGEKVAVWLAIITIVAVLFSPVIVELTKG